MCTGISLLNNVSRVFFFKFIVHNNLSYSFKRKLNPLSTVSVQWIPFRRIRIPASTLVYSVLKVKRSQLISIQAMVLTQLPMRYCTENTILAFPLLASTGFIATLSINTTRTYLLPSVPSCVLHGACCLMFLLDTFVHPFIIRSISSLREILPCTVASLVLGPASSRSVWCILVHYSDLESGQQYVTKYWPNHSPFPYSCS
jgi:hypothetical protein